MIYTQLYILVDKAEVYGINISMFVFFIVYLATNKRFKIDSIHKINTLQPKNNYTC